MSSSSNVCCLIRDCKKTCTNLTVLTDHLLNNHCSSKEGILHCPLCHHVTSTDRTICMYVTSTDRNIMTYHIRYTMTL